MKRISRVIIPVFFVGVLALSGCSTGFGPAGAQTGSTVLTGTQPGQQAPDFQLKDVDGQVVSLSGLRGKPVLLNFWATWCPPCRSEMPLLQQTYEEWSAKGLVLLAVDIGESPATVKEFLSSNKLTLPVLLDSQQLVAEQYRISLIPTTLFIDKDGIIRQRIVGAFPDRAVIETELQKIMTQ
ncbi:MAG: TlpA disulfide reductase family protein [Chloroflexota bacterium]